MKPQKPFFQSLSTRERALALNRSLALLLNEALSEISELATLTPLQKNFILAETSYVYQHFGFSFFGPVARTFVAKQMAQCSGIEERVLQTWLELLAFTLLEDFNMLKVVTGEPDWDAVDAAFFRDFARRILCMESGESADLGMEPWIEGFVGELCKHSEKWLEMTHSQTHDQVMADVQACCDETEFSRHLAIALEESLQHVRENLLQILIWRIQFLTSFVDIRQEAKFIVRSEGCETERKAARLAALLAMMVVHDQSTNELLLPPSPVSVNQICAPLKSGYSSKTFDASLFREWVGVNETKAQVEISQLVKEGVQAGLLFEVPNGKRGKGYGPTLAALRTLAPFQAAICTAALSTSASTQRVTV